MRLDGQTQFDDITCANLNIDLILDGGATDGKNTFFATESDYINGVYRPGQYEVTISGVVVDDVNNV